MARTTHNKPRAIGTGATASPLAATLAASLAVLKAKGRVHDRAAAVKRRAVAEAADTLTNAMRRLHRGRWSTTIDHDALFILIRPIRRHRKGGAS